MASPAQRARYWARSFAGWHEFADVGPNAAHHALSRLQRSGWVGHIVTQNVDRLHHKAGSSSVLELHGTTHESGSPCQPLPFFPIFPPLLFPVTCASQIFVHGVFVDLIQLARTSKWTGLSLVLTRCACGVMLLSLCSECSFYFEAYLPNFPFLCRLC